jgi:hypothetical protein
MEEVAMRTGLKPLAIAAFAGIIVLAIVVGFAISLASSKDSLNEHSFASPIVSATKPTNTSTISFATIVPPSVETVTVYPEAKDVSYDKLYSDDLYSVSYIANATFPQVEAFYEKQLSHDGWTLEWDNKGEEYLDESSSYSWTDSANTQPWDLSLFLDLKEITSGDPRGLRVEESLRRQPNLNRVPLYPDAHQVESTWQPSIKWTGFEEKHITYLTDATPQELSAYYKNILPQCGWSGPSEGFQPGDLNNDISKGIRYGWGTGGLHNLRYIGLTITSNSTSSGKTQVQIKLEGTLHESGGF